MTIALQKATLIKRYKRFLADITLSDGSITTIHVANTGAMTGCAEPGDTVWYSTSSNSKRKYPFSWEVTEKSNGDLICVNTIRANQFIEHAIIAQEIHQLTQYQTIQREVSYGDEKSKIDFLLTSANQPNTYIEVKSATLYANNKGYFPDAVTLRGQKHLRELSAMVEQGHKAILVFAILHSAINKVNIAKHIDPAYYQAFLAAKQQGVCVIEHKIDLTKHFHFTGI